MKSAPSNLSNWKISRKIENASTLEFVENEFLTHTGNFGIESAFFNGSGSAFSQGPGPDLGPLYKVCQITPKKTGDRMEISLSEKVRYFHILFHFSPDIGGNVKQ